MSESVFPYTLPSGAVVIDERCSCGAKRSEHNWRVPMLGLATHGHGDCARTECERFTWVRFIYRQDDCEPVSCTRHLANDEGYGDQHMCCCERCLAFYRQADCEHDNHATDLDGNYCIDCGLHETDSPNDRESDEI